MEICFGMQAGRMAVARHGGWATDGAAERMSAGTQELDELSCATLTRVAGDVRDALYEVVGVRPTQCAQWVHCAPNGAKPQEYDRDGRWSFARSAAQDNSKTSTTTSKSDAPTAPNNRGPRTEDRGPRTEDRAPAPAEPPMRDSNPQPSDSKSIVLSVALLSHCEINTLSVLIALLLCFD